MNDKPQTTQDVSEGTIALHNKIRFMANETHIRRELQSFADEVRRKALEDAISAVPRHSGEAKSAIRKLMVNNLSILKD